MYILFICAAAPYLAYVYKTNVLEIVGMERFIILACLSIPEKATPQIPKGEVFVTFGRPFEKCAHDRSVDLQNDMVEFINLTRKEDVTAS